MSQSTQNLLGTRTQNSIHKIGDFSHQMPWYELKSFCWLDHSVPKKNLIYFRHESTDPNIHI